MNPEIAALFSLYIMCKKVELVTYTMQKGNSTVNRMEPFTSGLMLLPDAGGILDQDYRTMEFFQEFMVGERSTFGK